jgi:transitional endoplasmic reticulum ATPase
MTLIVSDALEQDQGQQRARIDTKTRMAIGVSPGDIIRIVGKRTAHAIAWRVFQEDEGKGIIRMDSSIRKRARVSIGDKVIVQKAVLKPARQMVLEPIPQDPGMLQELLKEKLKGRPVQNADCFELTGFPQIRQRFRLIETVPKVPVQVTEDTEIIIQSGPQAKPRKTRKH